MSLASHRSKQERFAAFNMVTCILVPYIATLHAADAWLARSCSLGQLNQDEVGVACALDAGLK